MGKGEDEEERNRKKIKFSQIFNREIVYRHTPNTRIRRTYTFTDMFGRHTAGLPFSPGLARPPCLCMHIRTGPSTPAFPCVCCVRSFVYSFIHSWASLHTLNLPTLPHRGEVIAHKALKPLDAFLPLLCPLQLPVGASSKVAGLVGWSAVILRPYAYGWIHSMKGCLKRPSMNSSSRLAGSAVFHVLILVLHLFTAGLQGIIQNADSIVCNTHIGISINLL